MHGIEHKSVAARYPDIRKRKMEAGELVDESVIQEVDKKRRKFENEHGVGVVRENLDNSLPFLVNGVVVENSKKRVCEICKKVCMKPSDLKRHMMSHTGERPFKCEVSKTRHATFETLLHFMTVLLAHMSQVSFSDHLCQGSVWMSVHLSVNFTHFFSRTTGPISSKLAINLPWRKGIKNC